ncbi:MAG TPA: hypothetical protein VE153_17610 [Myxococcus sp.]|nr:hypothetical protein [Myxococcus sp.]
MFNVPEAERELWQALLPRFEYLLDDLTAEREEALLARAGPPLARLAFLVLHYGRTEDLARKLSQWTELFAQLQATREGREELVALLHYLMRIGDRALRAATSGVLNSVMEPRRAEEMMGTWADDIKQEVMVKYSAEMVLRLLTVRGVSVDESSRQRILTCRDMPTLNAWFDRAVHATRLSDVLDS